MTTNRKLYPSLFAATILCYGVFSHTGESTLDQDIRSESEFYCEMVEQGIRTNGEYGWPDYKQTYTETCLNETP